ncbi:MAG TPA: hypothetical protein VFU72_06910 [Nitrolancea sp.]|nr:hypothetical protein [Nitrolancea sp.]
MIARNIAPHLPGSGIIEGREPLLGQPAPEWQLRDEAGNLVTLKRLTRQQPLLLHLYRGAW